MTLYSIKIRRIYFHPSFWKELIPHMEKKGWNLVLQTSSNVISRQYCEKAVDKSEKRYYYVINKISSAYPANRLISL